MASIQGTIGFEQFSLLMENQKSKYDFNDKFPIAGYAEVNLIDEAWSIALAVQEVLIKNGYKNPINYVRVKQNSTNTFDVNWGAGIDAYKKKVVFEECFTIKESYTGWKVGNKFGL
jgi:hypothetical protein